MQNEQHKYNLMYSQSNDFVSSPYAQEFSAQELKTMEFIISQTTKDDIHLAENNQSKLISLSISKFANMIGAHPTDIYKRVNELSDNLMSKKIKLKYLNKNKQESFIKHTLFNSMAYDDGILTIAINPFVLPYFLELSGEFTQFSLENILRIGSSYGIKLYKLLKQYENSHWKTRKFTLIELREQFGISDEKYPRYNDFKRTVIDTAIKHINQSTDILVDYTEVKLGRKISELKFSIRPKLLQFDQARVFFNAFMNSLNEMPRGTDLLKLNWNSGVKHDEKRFKAFSKAFSAWVSLTCPTYIENSPDPLEMIDENSVFYDKQNIISSMFKAQFDFT